MKNFILFALLPQEEYLYVIILSIFSNMLLIGSNILRSSQSFSLPALGNRAIRPFHASRIQSVDRNKHTNEGSPVRRGLAEAKVTRSSDTIHKELPLASQEGHTGLLSHVL